MSDRPEIPRGKVSEKVGELPSAVSKAADEGTRVPNESLHVPGFEVEYLNHPVVCELFGTADPFRVAVELVTFWAAFVVTLCGGQVVL